MKKKNNNHLAEGEITGHYHKAVTADIFEDAYNDDSLLMETNGTEIIHQEHKVIEIPKGTYRTGQVLEYDPAVEEARKVKD